VNVQKKKDYYLFNLVDEGIGSTLMCISSSSNIERALLVETTPSVRARAKIKIFSPLVHRHRHRFASFLLLCRCKVARLTRFHDFDLSVRRLTRVAFILPVRAAAAVAAAW
jgi:hypothetical protein